jgi:hypothetical protein
MGFSAAEDSPVPRFFAAILACAIISLPTLPGRAEDDPRVSLPAELGWVKFRVTGGRIQAVNTQFRESKTYTTGNPLVGDTETFTLNVAQTTTLHYELKSAREQLVIDFDSPASLTIERRVGEDGKLALSFAQPAEGNLQLAIGDGESRKSIEAPSFWHLLLLAPAASREHLLPILDSLRPGWHLGESADGLNDALVQVAESGLVPDRTQWTKLVEQLGSDRFSERRTAERRLREAGPAVVAYLQTLPLASLDVERRVRVKRLLESLATTADDTPQRIAMWLIDDAQIWLAVLASEDAHQRRIAHEQLEKLAGMKLDFTPDADAQVRAQQIEAMRAKLPRE